MDPLAGIGRDEFRSICWAAAAAPVLLALLFRRSTLHWAAFASILVFAALNAVAGIYILNHLTDPRWSAAGASPLTAPSFGGTPVVGQFLGPLDSALNGVVDGVNSFLAFQQALPIALDFLATSARALLASFPALLVAAIISFIVAKRRVKEFKKYRNDVDRLILELDEVKRELGAMNSSITGTTQPVYVGSRP